MDKVKIAVIGAGSLAWAATIVRDLCLTPTLYGSEVVFMDIDEDRLRAIYSLAKRYSSEVKASFNFKRTTHRGEAARDADFVINMAMAKGHQYYERMRVLSERHGYYRGINSVEWNMVSDYHTIWGYYQFKLAMEVAKDVEELSNDAWLLQLANPVFELTTLISRESRVKVLGLCHGHLGYKSMVEVLGLDEGDVEVESIGFNHVIWMTKFRYRGEDAYPLLDEWIGREARRYWTRWRKEQNDPFDIQMSPAAVDMYKRYGLFPIGDTVRGGTWRYHWNLEVKRRWFGPTGGPDSEIGWEMYLRRNEERMRRIMEALTCRRSLTSLLPPKRSEESVIPIINSIVNDEPRIYQVNLLNRGAIDGLPDDVAVEVPVLVDARGVHRRERRKLPDRIVNLVMRPRLMRMEWALEAFLEGGRDMLLEWLMYDLRTRSEKQAEGVVDALLSLPGNEEMAKHFR